MDSSRLKSMFKLRFTTAKKRQAYIKDPPPSFHTERIRTERTPDSADLCGVLSAISLNRIRTRSEDFLKIVYA